MISLTAKVCYKDDEHDFIQVRVRSSSCTYYVDISSSTVQARGPGIRLTLPRWQTGVPGRIEDPEALALTIISLIEVGELP